MLLDKTGGVRVADGGKAGCFGRGLGQWKEVAIPIGPLEAETSRMVWKIGDA